MKRARMGIVLALTTALSAAAIAQLNAQNLVAQTQSANVELNGVTYRVEKSIVAGVVTRRYDDGQRARSQLTSCGRTSPRRNRRCSRRRRDELSTPPGPTLCST